MSASVPPSGHAPVLVAEDLRIDIDGVPACDGLGFRTKGEHVLVLGAPAAVFRAAAGLVRPSRGLLSVRGASATEAVARGIVAGVPAALPIPPRWTVTEYVAWSARLAGVPAEPARASVAASLDKLALGPFAKAEAARLVPAARRALVVASALASCAEVICLEDPLGGLPPDTVEPFGDLLAKALSDRAWIVFAPRMPLTSGLARAADDAIVASAFRVDTQGFPAELAAAERRFFVRFDGPAPELEAALAPHGARLEQSGSHATVDLGEQLSTSGFVALCEDAGVAVIDLVPAFRALS